MKKQTKGPYRLQKPEGRRSAWCMIGVIKTTTTMMMKWFGLVLVDKETEMKWVKEQVGVIDFRSLVPVLILLLLNADLTLFLLFVSLLLLHSCFCFCFHTLFSSFFSTSITLVQYFELCFSPRVWWGPSIGSADTHSFFIDLSSISSVIK